MMLMLAKQWMDEEEEKRRRGNLKDGSRSREHQLHNVRVATNILIIVTTELVTSPDSSNEFVINL
jgi:hypothetical protein